MLFDQDLGNRDVEKSVDVDLKVSKLYIRFAVCASPVQLRFSRACGGVIMVVSNRRRNYVPFCLLGFPRSTLGLTRGFFRVGTDTLWTDLTWPSCDHVYFMCFYPTPSHFGCAATKFNEIEICNLCWQIPRVERLAGTKFAELIQIKNYRYREGFPGCSHHMA